MVPATNAAQSLKVTYRGRASANCSQTLYAYNWTTSTWVQIDGPRTIGTTEIEVNVSLGGTLADFVSNASGTGDVAIRVRCTRDSGFYTRGDLLRVTYTS